MTERHDRMDTEYGVAPPGFRLPAGTRPGRIRLQVADLHRSLAYYEAVLGFRVLQRSAGSASLGAAAADEPLIELHERPGATSVPARRRLGLFHYAILLPGRASLGELIQHLSELNVAAGSADHLVSEALYLQDPDGLGIEVYADRPRSKWRHRDRQLVMATDPLDIGDLIRAAGNRGWSGMPAGTTIGHVHLHVGDLGRAADFYHTALGLDRMVWSYPGALFLAAGGYHHHVGLNTWAGAAPPASGDEARLIDWELLVPARADAEGAVSSMQSGGYVVEQSAEGALVRDPWGTALRIRTP